MLDITVIILTKNERLHIGRCIRRLENVASHIIVVDSHSTDGTQEIAQGLGAEVVEHDWPGNQAAQFNWALDNIVIDTEWVLRLDADEYLSKELIDELYLVIPTLDSKVSGIVMPLGRCFLGRKLRHGIVSGVSMIRMFRRGKARYESRIMDEHLKLTEGITYLCKGEFIDDNRLPLSSFISKHDEYAKREAITLLLSEYGDSDANCDGIFAEEVARKRSQKNRYANMPLFWRAFGYFLYRYFFKLGFLDGKEGFLWDFFQGWWYRTLVDAKIFEIKKKCGNDKEKIKNLLSAEYGFQL